MPYGFHNDRSKAELGAFVDFFYPVGAYFETSDVNFDPNVEWGGTWVLETEGLVHISAGTNYPVSGAPTDTKDGGNKDAIVPYHNHSDDISITVSGGGGHTITGGDHGHSFYYINTQTHQQTNVAAIFNTGLATSGFWGGSHSHWVSDHTHTTTKTGGVGYAGTNGNTVDANMQPYIVVNRWHRTA